MKLKGKTEAYLRSLSESGRVLHFSLFDPEKVDPDKLYKYAKMLFDAGTSAFLVGGTLNVNIEKLNSILDLLEDFDVPKIIFPSNINLISSKADAILFMSLLNSDDIYYIVGAQVVAAPIVRASGLEVLPTAYIIIGYGGTAAHVGRARVIPYDNLDLAIAYSLAAEYMGMRFIYLESGSGAPEPVRPEMVKAVRKVVKSFLLVGGGIRSKEAAIKLAEAGANAIVTGNIIEKDPEKAVEIIKGLKTVKLNDANI